jgi:two-component sensor histidine kinase
VIFGGSSEAYLLHFNHIATARSRAEKQGTALMPIHGRQSIRAGYVLPSIVAFVAFAAQSASIPFISNGFEFLIYQPAVALAAFTASSLSAIAIIAVSTMLGVLHGAQHGAPIGAVPYGQIGIHVVCGLAIIVIAQNWRRVYSAAAGHLGDRHLARKAGKDSRRTSKIQACQLSLALQAGSFGAWQYDPRKDALSGDAKFWQHLGAKEPFKEPQQNLSDLRTSLAPDCFGTLISTLRTPMSNSIDTTIGVYSPGQGQRSIRLRGAVEIAGGDRILAGVCIDVTNRRRALSRGLSDETIRLHDTVLIEELVHRTKNLFPVILSIVRLTAREFDRATEYQQALIERLRVLEAIHSLLARDLDHMPSIGELVGLELALFHGSDRVFCEGPMLLMADGAAESLSMIIHELATNSLKYGALANPRGRLYVRWRLNEEMKDSAGRGMIFEWTETRSGSANKHIRPGYGSSIIGATGQPLIGDSAKLEFRHGGMRYTLSIPSAKFSVAQAPDPTHARSRSSNGVSSYDPGLTIPAAPGA